MASPQRRVPKTQDSFPNAIESPVLLRSQRAGHRLPIEPWYSRTARISTFVIIPATALYMVFVYDWGPHNHVFSESHRWFERKKNSLWTMSPEEKDMVQRVEKTR